MGGTARAGLVGAAVLGLAACGAGGGGGSGVPVSRDGLSTVCANAAAQSFGTSPLQVLVYAVAETGRGYEAAGQAALPSGAVATFRCGFDSAGRFAGVTRTG